MGFKRLIHSNKLLSLLAVFMLLGTSLLAQTTTATTDASGTTPELHTDWMGVSYYVLLFLVLCFVIAIVGKILRVYDLTQQIQNKKIINWNTVMGIVCILFLVIGGYGAYWSITEQGSMSLPEAASLHGVKIDNMFMTTTIITMIVFVITQVILFWFLFRYRGSDKRKAYYLPHIRVFYLAGNYQQYRWQRRIIFKY